MIESFCHCISLIVVLVYHAQVIGSWGFIISATMFCLEVQKHWWLPRPLNLGWQARYAHFMLLADTDADRCSVNWYTIAQIGFWNIVGAFGFEFSAIFGCESSCCEAERSQAWLPKVAHVVFPLKASSDCMTAQVLGSTRRQIPALGQCILDILGYDPLHWDHLRTRRSAVR